jgi:UDP-N-acetylmuramyl pentapeptide phosphotransferase/UDP-N-acetylglucosamine-1-phosphate transferase
LFDVPDERKIHKKIVPRLGGIAFKPVILFSIFLLLGINMAFGHLEMLTAITRDIRPLAFGFCAIMLLYLVGMADDLIGIRYRIKFVIQILCGVMLIAGGMCIDNLYGVLGLYELPTWFGQLLVLLIVIFIINAINLIDGVDGLASGLCGCAFLLYGLIFLAFEQYIYAMLSFATLGVLVPFFYYNVFGNAERGRKIFMGDTGSMTIGIMLCILSIKLASCTPTGVHMPNPMVLAFSPLCIPCLDVMRVFMHRVRNKKNPFLPDKSHIHHKILSAGIKELPTMIIIVSLSIAFTAFNILLSLYIDINYIVIADILIWTVANIWLTNKIKQKNGDLVPKTDLINKEKYET